MSSLPKEIFSNITNFLPNDDITDLMLMSRNFNALVTPRLKIIDEEMATMNQSIKSFMPTPHPDRNDRKWIHQLNLKKFEPIGSKAKKQMKKVIEDQAFIKNCLRNLEDPYVGSTMLSRLKKGMSLERFDAPTFLRIFGALVARPKFRQEYNVSPKLIEEIYVWCLYFSLYNIYPNDSFADVERILHFYKNK